MTWLNIKNNAESTLASGISAAATSLSVSAGDGSKFPSSNFNITIDGEIMLCTTRTGDVLTVTRAQEGTTAAIHAAATVVGLYVTAGIVSQLQTGVDAAFALGVTGGNAHDHSGGDGAQIDHTTLANKGTKTHADIDAALGTFPVVNTTPCRYSLGTNQANIPAGTTTVRIDLDIALYDIGSNFTMADWYGTSSNYAQADSSGCGSTNIKKTGAAFPLSIINSLVKWASNAGGTLNTGYGYVATVVDSNNLTIVKASGADFANSYYFWIRKNHYIVPSTGLYLITAAVRWDPTEDQKRYIIEPCGGPISATPTFLNAQSFSASGTNPMAVITTFQCYLTAGDMVALVAAAVGSANAITIIGTSAPASMTSLSIVRIA